MFRENMFQKIEKNPSEEFTFLDKEGKEHLDMPSVRKANEIYWDMVQGKSRVIELSTNKNILPDYCKMSYKQWNVKYSYFRNSLGRNEVTLEYALLLAEHLRDANVIIDNPKDALIMGEQLQELLGIICALKEAQLKIEQR